MYALNISDKYIMRISYYDNLSSFGTGDLKDYRHASALYLRNNFRLAGKPKFLYHVVLNVNFEALQTLGPSVASTLGKREFNLLVENSDLPTYTVEVSTLNQYNRKRLNQTKINFNPVAMRFHDDMAGVTTLLWEAYYRYYYQDPNYRDGFFVKDYVYGQNTYKGSALNSFSYGLDKKHPVPFFTDITINQLYTDAGNPSYTSFTLINPIIQEVQHDQVDQGATDLAKTTMRFSYESVLYDRGYSGIDSPAGFRDPSHYDTTPSSLTLPDSAALIPSKGRPTFWDIFAGVIAEQIEANDRRN